MSGNIGHTLPINSLEQASQVNEVDVRFGPINGNDASRLECPLIPRTQTSIDAFYMSASGHFRIHATQQMLSGDGVFTRGAGDQSGKFAEAHSPAPKPPPLAPIEERDDPNPNPTDAQRAPRQGSNGLFGRLLRAALYAFSSAFGICAAGLSAFC